MGTIIVIPPSVLMDQIFRKVKPRTNKTDALIEKMKENAEKKKQGRIQ